jgi:hypothetical protein
LLLWPEYHLRISDYPNIFPDPDLLAPAELPESPASGWSSFDTGSRPPM